MSSPLRPDPAPPVGWPAIRAYYGYDPSKVVDGAAPRGWEAGLVSITLPQPMVLSWDPDTLVRRIRLHPACAVPFYRAYQRISEAGLWALVRVYGGGYAWRPKRDSSRLSMHALGAAVDHDPHRNPHKALTINTAMGGTPEGRRVVELMAEQGITWGGDFSTPDAMHFQFGSGY